LGTKGARVKALDHGGKIRICYNAYMTAKALKDVMELVESWPKEAQEELAEIAREMEAGLQGGVYHASAEELAGIDRGLPRDGRFATDEDVEKVFAKHRRP
jgi:hypothetical protein